MLTLKDSAHIRTNRHIKGFRSCEPYTAVSLARLDRGRIAFEEEKMAWREARRHWLVKQWSKPMRRS